MCVQDISKKFDSSTHKDTMELATQMWWAAQQESEYQRRLTNERLNQAGKKISNKAFNIGDEIYFYKPPSQDQAIAIGRKIKHMAHYHGPATITKSLGSNSYKFTYGGKEFQRDAGMISRYFPMPVDVSWTDERHLLKPSKHKTSTQLWPGEFIITKDDVASETRYVAQVSQVLPDRVRINYYTGVRSWIGGSNYAGRNMGVWGGAPAGSGAAAPGFRPRRAKIFRGGGAFLLKTEAGGPK